MKHTLFGTPWNLGRDCIGWYVHGKHNPTEYSDPLTHTTDPNADELISRNGAKYFINVRQFINSKAIFLRKFEKCVWDIQITSPGYRVWDMHYQITDVPCWTSWEHPQDVFYMTCAETVMTSHSQCSDNIRGMSWMWRALNGLRISHSERPDNICRMSCIWRAPRVSWRPICNVLITSEGCHNRTWTFLGRMGAY